MKNARAASEYARYVIDGRWPEAEPIIMQSAQFAYEYARYVIKGRWPEAEPTIMKDAHWASWYVLKLEQEIKEAQVKLDALKAEAKKKAEAKSA